METEARNIVTDFLEEMVNLVDVPPYEDYSFAEIVRYRYQVKAQVQGCTECELHKVCNKPVPATYPSPHHQPTFTVIGEAPGPDEDRQGKPFVGKSGKKLRELMRQVGLDDTAATWMNTVSCFPNERGKIRPPSKDEKVACRENMLNQLGGSRSRYVLLVGGQALNTWRPEFNITDVHGKVGFLHDTWLVMPVYHPSYVLRNQGMEQTLVEDLEKWRMVVEGELGLLGWMSDRCWHCGEYVGYYDRDGVGYCERHWERYGKNWERARMDL